MQYYRFEVQGFAMAFMNIMDDIPLLLLFFTTTVLLCFFVQELTVSILNLLHVRQKFNFSPFDMML